VGQTPAMTEREDVEGARCPCGLPAAYDDCCGRFHRGDKAPPTAELLMRSRYAAYARSDAAYLLSSWHPSTRPRRIDPDPELRWTRLEIIATTAGGLLDQVGTVSFRAHHERRGQPAVLTENSRFERHDGRWAYVDAVHASVD